VSESLNEPPAAALALAVPALALGGAACGSGGAMKTSAQDQHRAEQHWRAGLLRWSQSMQGALNGLSIIFSSQGSLDSVRRTGSHTSASLATYELTMVRCTRTVRRYRPSSMCSRGRTHNVVRASLAASGRSGRGRDASPGDGLTRSTRAGAGDLLSAGQA
jgi:hypothetical protein